MNSWAVAHLAHHVLLRTLIQSIIWHSVRRMHQGHTKLPVRSPGKQAFCRGQLDTSYTKTFSESAWRNDFSMVGTATASLQGRESNRASLIMQLISGKIVLIRVSKPKANTLNICYDVFVTVNLSWRLNACITVVINRLTHVVFHKVV